MTELKRTQQDIGTLQQPGLYRFSAGLYLQVSGPDAKSWLYRYTINKQARAMGLGSARDMTFAEARKAVDELRVTKVSKKIDPLAEKRAQAARAEQATEQAIPFRERAKQYIAAHEDGWRNVKHRDQWRSTLETYVYPTIGDKPASAVTVSDVVEILRPLWVEKAETARRVRGRIESILDYAADPDNPLYRNPAMLTAQLGNKLPKLPKGTKAQKQKHHPALPYEKMATFAAELRAKEGIAARALEFAILTAARTSEVLGARWDEIDTHLAIWTIPAERMKGGREHRVPLSHAALAILATVRREHNGEVVFPSLPYDRLLSNMAMLTVLKRMGRRDLTVHGFRSSFRTWAEEETDFPRGVCEAALAHALKDKTEAAYQRGELLKKRRELMNAWADYCGRTQ